MKKGIHPEYRPVVFQDTAANFSFLSRSTAKTADTVVWSDGQTYPLIKLDISLLQAAGVSLGVVLLGSFVAPPAILLTFRLARYKGLL